MDLDRIQGRRHPGASLDSLDLATTALLADAPLAYRDLLAQSDGIDLDAGPVLYATSHLVERNETYELAAYLPGFLTIGDDGGGRAFLVRLSPTSPVYTADHGALGSAEPTRIAASVTDWVAAGCPMEPAGREAFVPSVVDVYLDALPDGKVRHLLAIKKGLGLDTPISELKTLAAELPACLARDVAAGKFMVRVRAIHETLGPCLSLRNPR